MRLDALEHPKTLHLGERLGITRPTTIGHLELLWAFVGKQSPQGNIGKWPDGAIARAAYWQGDAAEFVAGLVAAGFLDRCEASRLVVHDWPDHCPSWVRSKLKRAGLSFIVATPVAYALPTILPTHVAPTRAPVPSEGKGSVEKGCELDSTRDWIRSDGPARSPTASVDNSGDKRPNDPQPHEARQVFEQVRGTYPEGTYGAQNWILAEREVGRLLEQGESAASILDAARAYGLQQASMGNVGTQWIRSPEKFYREGWWRGPFKLPEARKDPEADRIASNIAAGQEWLARGST